MGRLLSGLSLRLRSRSVEDAEAKIKHHHQRVAFEQDLCAKILQSDVGLNVELTSAPM